MISPVILWKIYNLISHYAPEVETEIKKQMMEKEPPRTLAKPAAKKKNKPMSKTEQERKIEQLKNSMQEFERHNSGSQEPVLPSK
jgi:bromodomain-containing factor 1